MRVLLSQDNTLENPPVRIMFDDVTFCSMIPDRVVIYLLGENKHIDISITNDRFEYRGVVYKSLTLLK
jgi:hypothetical protein